jgi:hypothetical protein
MTSYSTLRAGVFFNWYDQATGSVDFNTSIGAMAFHADRGPIVPYGSGDYTQFANVYGVNDYRRGYGHDTAKAFFRTGEAALSVRSPGQGARYANAVVANNKLISGDVLVYDGTSITGMGGSDVDYRSINVDFKDIILSAPLPKGATLTLLVNETEVATISNGDHTAFMRAVATGVLAVSEVSSAVAVNQKNVSSSNLNAAPPLIIRVSSKQNETLDIAAELTSANDITVQVVDTEWLAVLVADNPGAWGSGVGSKFVKLNRGRNAKSQILFSDVCAAQHSFSATVNGNAIVVTAKQDSNTLLSAIATEVNKLSGLSASVLEVPGSNHNRVITVTATDNKTDIVIESAAVIQNNSLTAPPIVVTKVVMSRYSPETDFSFNVYEYPDMRRIVNSYTATLRETLDATGEQTNFESLVNSGTGSTSLLRAYVNPEALDNGWEVYSDTTLNRATGEGFLSGGENGLLSTSADIIEAWSKMADPVRYQIRILMNCGYTTPEVHSYMTQMCESRRDCHAILDMSAMKQDAGNIGLTEVQARHEMNIDSSRASIYTPDIWIFDVDRRLERYSPPSGYVGAIYALTGRTRREWWSPAGLNRGWIPEARGLRVDYDDAAQSNLAEAQINPIINYKGARIVVFGDWTLQYRPSPMQYVGTRRMCNSIEIIATNTVAYSLYEPNTKSTRGEVIRVSKTILQEYLDGEGIARYDS